MLFTMTLNCRVSAPAHVLVSPSQQFAPRPWQFDHLRNDVSGHVSPNKFVLGHVSPNTFALRSHEPEKVSFARLLLRERKEAHAGDRPLRVLRGVELEVNQAGDLEILSGRGRDHGDSGGDVRDIARFRPGALQRTLRVLHAPVLEVRAAEHQCLKPLHVAPCAKHNPQRAVVLVRTDVTPAHLTGPEPFGRGERRERVCGGRVGVDAAENLAHDCTRGDTGVPHGHKALGVRGPHHGPVAALLLLCYDPALYLLDQAVDGLMPVCFLCELGSNVPVVVDLQRHEILQRFLREGCEQRGGAVRYPERSFLRFR
mmetsp:Transcript_52327/g.122759  ORF Transcript_52327/g.122759 Transcript_52327/m.122759 type:complete len:313 (+) Transcript_52327:24-962(+)